MRLTQLIAGALVALFVVACINLPDVESPSVGEPDAGLPDGGTSNTTDAGTDAGVPDGGAIPATIVIESPSHTVFTKGSVEVRIGVSGDPAESIELFANNSLLSTLTPPFIYIWDTHEVPEGTYSLQARIPGTHPPPVSEVRTIIIDRTPPQLTLRTPAPGSTNVSVKSAIQAQFSEALESTTITDSTVTLSAGSTHLAKTLSLSADGRTLTIAPASPPTAPTQLSVAFSADATDLAGNGLVAPATAWNWNLPEWLTLANSLGFTSAYVPSIALAPSGDPVVAWKESDIFVQRWDATGWVSLGGAVSINPGDTPSDSPSLQIKSSATPVIAWAESDGIAENIYVREWVTDSWQALGSALSAYPGSTNASFPSLGLKVDGSPVVAWSESDGTVSNVHVRQWTSGTWQQIGPPLSANTGNTDARFPQMVLDSTGNPVVAWKETDGTTVNLYVKRWVGAAWQSVGSALSAYPGTTDVQDHAIALDPAGNPVVAWTEPGGPTGYAVHIQRWTGSIWQAVGGAVTSGLSTYYTDGLALKITAQGLPIVAWVEMPNEGSADPQLHMWRWTQFAWQHMATFGNGQPSAPALALDASDNAILAWSDQGVYDNSIFVLRQNR